jgi:hypothetical protein
VDNDNKVSGFVSLTSVKKGAPDPAAALADIRRIYFKTTRATIEHDLAHAIELLKALPDEEQREKATVFMEGLAQMRKEWGAADQEKQRPRKLAKGPKETLSRGVTAKRRRTARK